MLTPLAVSTLALFIERPMHPYELYQLLRERHEDQIVKVKPGSLYHTVERLERDGLVQPTGTDRAGNRPERTTYAITPEGREALRERLIEMLSAPINEYPEFPLALSESHNLPVDLVVRHLHNRRERLDEQVAELDDLIATVRKEEVHEAYWFVADYLRTVQRAERDWIHTLAQRLQSKELSWPLANKTN